MLFTGRAGGARAESAVPQSRFAVAGPGAAFGVGFGIAAINPALLANWSMVVAMAHASVGFELAPERVWAFAVGVVTGIVAWFGFVLAMLARYGERFDSRARGRVLKWVGTLLLVLAVALAGKVVRAALA